MELEKDCLDDLLNELYKSLFQYGTNNEGTRGKTKEILGVTLRLSNPRARISRSNSRGKIFSAMGELLWYLKKSDKLLDIEPFIPLYRQEAINGIVPGAYGPRIFNMRGEIDQFNNVINLLKSKPTTKRAVIQIFDAQDINGKSHHETPCTTTLQLHQRQSKLHMSVNMRSNDAYLGLPHDVFCFTMLQEMMARNLSVELGEYIHHVGSMHVYEKHHSKIQSYITEGYHRIEPMPRMPEIDPFTFVPKLLTANDYCRSGLTFAAEEIVDNEYWADLIRLIQAYWSSGNKERLEELAAQLNNPAYSTYIMGLSHSTPKTNFMTNSSE